MKFIKILLIINFLLPVYQAFSQRVVLHQTNADKQYEIPKKGANRQQNIWVQLSLFGTDLAFGELDSKQDFFNNYFGLSVNKKYKLNGILSHGYGCGVHRQVYRMSDNGLHTALRPDWDKGKFVFVGGHVNYFVRFNFDPKRGNIRGYYLDLAPFGQYNFYQRAEFVQGKLTEKSGKENFPERFAIGVETRFGREFLSIYARYKFLSINQKSGTFTDMDFAKWSVGFHINI
jgi:hypothetical protein